MNQRSDALEPEVMFLVVRRPDGTEVVDVADGGSVTIGRVPGATIAVDYPWISREHARIRRAGGALWLRDLGSRNGTHVGASVLMNDERRLAPGDVIKLGDVEIIVPGARRDPDGMPVSRPAEETGTLTLPAGIVVADPVMVEVFRLTRRAARTGTTVLVRGETGAGKEIVARQIHGWSQRAAGPFVCLNCASLPLTLLASALFGYEKGAFTGADRRKIGYLEAATGGTIFLDEVGDLPPEVQVKLLRVLESRRLVRVGGTQEIPIDIRVVSATHKDLGAETAAGRFREDLYFRLCAFTIAVPPLRERLAEIGLLADIFAREGAARMDIPPPLITAEAAAALAVHAWPGNVRELRNAIEHALVVTETDRIELSHLPESVRGSPGEAPEGAKSSAVRARVEDRERKSIEDALVAADGNHTHAAKRLGISRRGLIYKLHKYGLMGPRPPKT